MIGCSCQNPPVNHRSRFESYLDIFVAIKIKLLLNLENIILSSEISLNLRYIVKVKKFLTDSNTDPDQRIRCLELRIRIRIQEANYLWIHWIRILDTSQNIQ